MALSSGLLYFSWIFLIASVIKKSVFSVVALEDPEFSSFCLIIYLQRNKTYAV